MPTAFEIKEQAVPDTPLLLFDCRLPGGTLEHWSTHQVVVAGTNYQPRVLQHNLFEIQTSSDQGVDAIPKIAMALANADSHFSEIERSVGFKGATLTASFVFFDLREGAPTTAVMTLFQGILNPPDTITESTFRITAVNRMNMQRVLLPQVRVQRRCPWEFPSNADQRAEAASGGSKGPYSRFYRCGYSPDIVGGAGNLNGTVPYTSCGFTRADCVARGMFHQDASLDNTQRFGGLEFVPSATLVRSHGEQGRHWSAIATNEARYNDFVPLIYGTVWFSPGIVFARNDGNLTRMEVLLGMGEVHSVIKVLVNDIDIPLGRAGANMTKTGWFNLFSAGTRTGGFNLDFADASGNPLGDPYGSMAALSVVVPNQVSDGRSLPDIKILVEGSKLLTYASDGSPAGQYFTRNPAWILLDILRRCGWELAEIDLASFASAAAYADEEIDTQDLHGNAITMPRFQCNLALTRRRTAGDLIRGIRNGARLCLTYGAAGLLRLQVENSIALQQASKPAWSNSTSHLNGGWPSYEFGDGSSGVSGILRRDSGEASLRLWTRSITDTPNRFSVEFQDSLNEYQQDSYSLVDVDDVETTGQEITASIVALGIPNYDQAARVLKFNLDRSVHGNTYVEFETSVKALGLRPGDLVTLTYLKEGFNRQAFRVIKIAPSVNYRTAVITGQIHDDAWYYDTNGQVTGDSGAGPQPGSGLGLPRPLMGTVTDAYGEVQFGIGETAAEASDGGQLVDAVVSFATPAAIATGAPGIPLLSLAATLAKRGQRDGRGGASRVGSRFIIRATIPAGPDTNTVTLTGLSFAAAATKFQVYRGPNPSQLFRIATDQTIATEFTDTGLPEQAIPPPDANFDHANFYWRLEKQPEYAATLHSANSIGNGIMTMIVNAYRGVVVRITRGKGEGQERSIGANTTTELQLNLAWDTEPDASSYFVVTESGWHFGATAKTSPVQFEIPNRTGETIELSGRAANANDGETPVELCTVTRWVIGGAGGTDAAAPPEPSFGIGISTTTDGTIELSGVSFSDFTNTHTISAGTLSVYYWSELNTTAPASLAAAIDADDTLADLTVAGGAAVGSFVQIEGEIARVDDVLMSGTRYQLTRGMHGSTAAAHGSGLAVITLLKKTEIVPFVKSFFGSPFSGSWSYPVFLPDCRVVSAELVLTNIAGNSPTGAVCLTSTVDYGLRTLSGGQFSFQVEAFLAVETGATPDLIVQSAHSVRDVYAVVRQAPVGGDISLTINQNGDEYCSLTIGATHTVSDPVGGSGLPVLIAGGRLSLDITGVGATNPGADLTVIIRL